LVNVNYGGSQTFTYSADSGCVIRQVIVDNSPVAITGSYTFTDVQAPHTITVSSSIISSVSSTAQPSPTPKLSSTASPTSNATQAAPSSGTLKPTSIPTMSPSPLGFSLWPIRLPEFLGLLISACAVLAVSLLLPPYIRTRRKAAGDMENHA
jgi:hypothetical protein